ncbi:hypothetical protein [Agaribacterium sp. ZY112]|uniref:hypothetical protein n=1 Tax=Agaribacterium sp. ZY112 TaxID=3233574 RepID=UPI00352355B7
MLSQHHQIISPKPKQQVNYKPHLKQARHYLKQNNWDTAVLFYSESLSALEKQLSSNQCENCKRILAQQFCRISIELIYSLRRCKQVNTSNSVVKLHSWQLRKELGSTVSQNYIKALNKMNSLCLNKAGVWLKVLFAQDEKANAVLH